jgi:hypothetical protein
MIGGHWEGEIPHKTAYLPPKRAFFHILAGKKDQNKQHRTIFKKM